MRVGGRFREGRGAYLMMNMGLPNLEPRGSRANHWIQTAQREVVEG